MSPVDNEDAAFWPSTAGKGIGCVLYNEGAAFCVATKTRQIGCVCTCFVFYNEHAAFSTAQLARGSEGACNEGPHGNSKALPY